MWTSPIAEAGCVLESAHIFIFVLPSHYLSLLINLKLIKRHVNSLMKEAKHFGLLSMKRTQLWSIHDFCGSLLLLWPLNYTLTQMWSSELTISEETVIQPIPCGKFKFMVTRWCSPLYVCMWFPDFTSSTRFVALSEISWQLLDGVPWNLVQMSTSPSG